MKESVTVFSPDVTPVTNMSITKTDILNIFETDFREDLEKRKKEALEKAKAQKEIMEGISKQGDAVLAKESDRIISRFKSALEGIAIFSKELEISVEFAPDTKKKAMKAIFVFKTKNMDSRMGRYMIGFVGMPGYFGDPLPVNLEAVVDREVLEEYEKIAAQVKREEKILQGFDREIRILENEIHYLPNYVKKFSSDLTRESLQSLPKGKALLENIKEMTVTAMKQFEQEFQQKLLGGYQLL